MNSSSRVGISAMIGGGIASLADLRGLLSIGLPMAIVAAALWSFADANPDKSPTAVTMGVEVGLAFVAMYWQRRLLIGAEPMLRRRTDSEIAAVPAPLTRGYLWRGVALCVAVIAPAVGVSLFLVASRLDGSDADFLRIAVPSIVLCAVMALVLGRFFLVFPSLAEGKPMGFGDAWRMGRGQGLKLGLMLILLTLPELVMISAFVLLVPETFLATFPRIVVLNLFLALVRVATTLVTAAGLAIAWRGLSANDIENSFD